MASGEHAAWSLGGRIDILAQQCRLQALRAGHVAELLDITEEGLRSRRRDQPHLLKSLPSLEAKACDPISWRQGQKKRKKKKKKAATVIINISSMAVHHPLPLRFWLQGRDRSRDGRAFTEQLRLTRTRSRKASAQLSSFCRGWMKTRRMGGSTPRAPAKFGKTRGRGVEARERDSKVCRAAGKRWGAGAGTVRPTPRLVSGFGEGELPETHSPAR